MNMRRTVLVMAAICSLAINAGANSVHLGGNMGIGVANDNVETGFALQGYLELDAAQYLAFRGTALLYAGETEVGDLSAGDFTMPGAEASIIFKLPIQIITPYIGAGAGYYLPDTEISDDTELFLAYYGMRGEEDIQSGAGFHAMGGIAIELSKNFAIDFNLKYVYFKTDVDVTVTDFFSSQSVSLSEKIDLSTLLATAGLKITF